MSNPDDPASWTAKAENDLLCIANNLNDPQIPWDAVCFHAQQAAEKMLKAFLVSRG
jgi:HEPN domain-containing protein